MMNFKKCEACGKCCCGGCGAGAVYVLGLIGAAIYFIGQAGTFWAGVLGFLKAVVWPVFLVRDAFAALVG